MIKAIKNWLTKLSGKLLCRLGRHQWADREIKRMARYTTLHGAKYRMAKFREIHCRRCGKSGPKFKTSKI